MANGKMATEGHAATMCTMQEPRARLIKTCAHAVCSNPAHAHACSHCRSRHIPLPKSPRTNCACPGCCRGLRSCPSAAGGLGRHAGHAQPRGVRYAQVAGGQGAGARAGEAGQTGGAEGGHVQQGAGAGEAVELPRTLARRVGAQAVRAAGWSRSCGWNGEHGQCVSQCDCASLRAPGQDSDFGCRALSLQTRQKQKRACVPCLCGMCLRCSRRDATSHTGAAGRSVAAAGLRRRRWRDLAPEQQPAGRAAPAARECTRRRALGWGLQTRARACVT